MNRCKQDTDAAEQPHWNDNHDTDGTMIPISGSTTATRTPSPNVMEEEEKNDTVGDNGLCDVDTMNSHAATARMMMVHNVDSAAAAAASQDCAVETPLWVVPKKPLVQRLDNGRTKTAVAKPLKIARHKKWSKAVGKVGTILY
jgi:hypothetical protein